MRILPPQKFSRGGRTAPSPPRQRDAVVAHGEKPHWAPNAFGDSRPFTAAERDRAGQPGLDLNRVRHDRSFGRQRIPQAPGAYSIRVRHGADRCHFPLLQSTQPRKVDNWGVPCRHLGVGGGVRILSGKCPNLMKFLAAGNGSPAVPRDCQVVRYSKWTDRRIATGTGLSAARLSSCPLARLAAPQYKRLPCYRLRHRY